MTAKGNMKQPPLPTVVSWVKTAWDRIPADMVQRTFLKYKINNNLDWSEDDALWQEEENEESDVQSDVEDTRDASVFWGQAGHADPLDGCRCFSQKRVMSRRIKVRQH